MDLAQLLTSLKLGMLLKALKLVTALVHITYLEFKMGRVLEKLGSPNLTKKQVDEFRREFILLGRQRAKYPKEW